MDYTKLKWNSNYPGKKVLREEINFIIEAFIEVLLEKVPESEIEMIYFKGSAQKKWDFSIDYVPELSDIDIHILFSDESSIKKYLGSTSKALAIQSKVETLYFSKSPNPLHIPRPQLMVLNLLMEEKDFIPTPKSAVSVLYGKDYPKPDYSNDEKIKNIDRNRILSEEKFLSEFSLKVIDKPSKYISESLRTLVWHVSPIVPRVLHILGISTEEAWSINRSRSVLLLREMGEKQLALDYADYYLSGWEYFLSKYQDTNAGRSSIISGANALARGIEIAKKAIK